MSDGEIDRDPTTTLVSDLKRRLQAQHAVLNRTGTDVSLLHIRAELDALWECVEALAQIADGIPHDRVIVRDYFTEPRETPKRRWWNLPAR